MKPRALFYRALLKLPRIQRLEVIEVADLGARIVQVPKAGSGTIRMQVINHLRQASGEDLPKQALWDLVRFVRPEDLPGLQPPRFSFGFVRDPYARLVSCYRHKILRLRDQGRRISPIFAVYGRTFSPATEFPDFIRAVAAIPDARAEKHFRSQTRFLYRNGEPIVDFVGRLERFDADWAEVCRHTGFAPVDRAYNVTDREGGAADDWYDPELISLVNRRYAADFDLLGYQRR